MIMHGMNGNYEKNIVDNVLNFKTIKTFIVFSILQLKCYETGTVSFVKHSISKNIDTSDHTDISSLPY